MKCPACGSSSLDFQADRFICTACGEAYPTSRMDELLSTIGDWMKGSDSDKPSSAGDTAADAPLMSLSETLDAFDKLVESGAYLGNGARGLSDAHCGGGEPDADAADPIAELNSMTWRLVGEVMASSVGRIRKYGERYDKLDAERGDVMRKHLNRSIAEQFELDLESVASRFALADGKVTPEELSLINGALGLNLDEASLRERGREHS